MRFKAAVDQSRGKEVVVEGRAIVAESGRLAFQIRLESETEWHTFGEFMTDGRFNHHLIANHHRLAGIKADRKTGFITYDNF